MLLFVFGATAPPPVGQGLLIHEVSRSHVTMHNSWYDSSGWQLTLSQRPLPDNTYNTHNRQKSVPSVGFEPTISAGERPQTYALDRAATGTGLFKTSHSLFMWIPTDRSKLIFQKIANLQCLRAATIKEKIKCKVIPLQARCGPEGG